MPVVRAIGRSANDVSSAVGKSAIAACTCARVQRVRAYSRTGEQHNSICDYFNSTILLHRSIRYLIRMVFSGQRSTSNPSVVDGMNNKVIYIYIYVYRRRSMCGLCGPRERVTLDTGFIVFCETPNKTTHVRRATCVYDVYVYCTRAIGGTWWQYSHI